MVSLHRYTTEQLQAEITRRESRTDAQAALEALRCSWEVVGVIAARAGLRRGVCVAALGELARDGQAQWTVRAGVKLWRLAK